jgi:hypothetical protein
MSDQKENKSRMLPHFSCYNVRHFETQKHGRKKYMSNLTLAARTILILLF